MSKIRVLQVIGGLNRGGSETFLMNALRNINREKYSFVFLCYGDSKYDYEDEAVALGAKIVRLPDVKEAGIRTHIKDIKQVILRERIDVVHAHTYYNSIFSLIAGKKAGASIRIAHSHNTHSELLPKIVKRLYFVISRYLIDKYCTYRLACSVEAGKAFFLKKRDFDVINNGININDFVFNEKTRQKFRKEFAVENNFVIGHIGRFDDQKNHNFLIDIFYEIYKLSNDAVLLLIGKGLDEEKIKEKVKNLNLGKNVHFMGIRSDVGDLMQAMDVFVFPSKYEGLGNVLIEAQAAGLKCFTSKYTVPQEAKILDNFEYLSLDDGSKKWAARIISSRLDASIRKDTSSLVRSAGYDMRNEVSKLEHLYSGFLQ